MAKGQKGRKVPFLTIILIFILACFIVSIAYKWLHREPSEPIRVEVLNACGVHKLAKRTTEILRDMGFDVVYYGNATSVRERTVVVERYSMDLRNARRVARALGVKEILVDIDTTGVAQVSVILGKDYRKIKKLNRREFVL